MMLIVLCPTKNVKNRVIQSETFVAIPSGVRQAGQWYKMHP